MSVSVPSRAGRRLAAAAVTGALTLVSLVTVGVGPAAALVPTAPVALPTAIEVMPPYQPQTFCDPVEKPGVKAFASVLTATYPGTSIVSTTRACGTDTSEHYDGRALDWGVNVANPKQLAQGRAFLKWLFAPDAAGAKDAMVRRLGIMYVIWNKRIWGAWSGSWAPYSCSGVTACHQDHMHLSFDWSGAMRKTSFWTGRVTAPMPPPLFSLRTIGETHTITVDAHDPVPPPQYRLVAGARYRFTVARAYSYDQTRHHRADAACSTTDGVHWTPTPDPSVAAEGAFDLTVNGHGGWKPTGSTGSCSPTHSYHRSLTMTTRAPLALALGLTNPWAADGRLVVTVTRVA